MLIAQITDTHIKLPGKLAYGRVDTAAMLSACVNRIRRLNPQPDLIVMTGDLVDFGLAEEYAHLRRQLAPLTQPLVVIPGNHDERENFRAAFADQAYLPHQGFLHFALDDYPLRIVGVDTLIPGQGGGELCAERAAWLEATLAARPSAPTLVLMHHPPFLTGIDHMDQIGLNPGGRQAYAEIIARQPQVQATLCGHLHRMIVAQVGQRPALTSPSTAHQVSLALAPAAPSDFCLEPPGFLLHRWQNGELVSHQVCIDDYAGPYPFFADGMLID